MKKNFMKMLIAVLTVAAVIILPTFTHAQKFQGKFLNNLNNDGVILV